MDLGSSEKVEWFIIFSLSRHDSWLMRRLKPNFKHVYAMKKTEGGNFWQIVNPTVGMLKVHQVLVSEFPHPRCYADFDAVILPVKAIIDTKQVRGTICLFNCVEVVKALLGIKSFWTFTPWQLYKYITKGERHE